MRKILAALLFGGAVMAFGSAAAVAADPDRTPIVNEPFVDDSCGFPVDLSFPAQNETATTFYDAAGNVTKVIVTGRLVITFTNLSNGISLTVNASGPNVLDFQTGRFMALGAGGGPLPDEGIVSGHGQLDLVTGDFNGHVVPLCGALAGD